MSELLRIDQSNEASSSVDVTRNLGMVGTAEVELSLGPNGQVFTDMENLGPQPRPQGPGGPVQPYPQPPAPPNPPFPPQQSMEQSAMVSGAQT